MILHIFDDDFGYRGRVENWINLSWTEEYRGEGKFTITVYDTDQYAALLRHGWYLYRADRPAAMMIVEIARNTDENTITASGYTALHLLSRRAVLLPYAITNVESGIYGMINKDLRGLSQVVTATAKGLTDEYECEIEGADMLDAVFEVLTESNYGIRAKFDRANKRHVIEVYEGVNRAYNASSGGTLFKQEFGNLKSLKVTQDDDLYKNVAYVTGAANNDSRTVYYQYMDSDTAAGAQKDWREVLVDGDNQKDDETNPEWQARQKQTAINALRERKNALTFEVELVMGEFGSKYDLGDKVTCKSDRYGLQFDTRIMEYQYTSNQGAETVKIVLGNKPAGYVKSEIVKSSSGGRASATPGGGVGISELLNAVYPVGAIYISVSGADPGTLFGGTWERLKDRFLLAAGDSYAAGATGGEAAHTLTAKELPAHGHDVKLWNKAGTLGNHKGFLANGKDYYDSQGGLSGGSFGIWTTGTWTCAQSGYGDQAGITSLNGGGLSHNNMPPYLAVYMWKRTA